MATYVIGDIHGEYEQLGDLVQKMQLKESDELYVLGDVVDRGPASVKCLRYLMSLPNCACIAGNHELMMLSNMKLLLREISDDLLDGLSEEDMGLLLDWMSNGGTTTIKKFSALSSDERKEILDYVGHFDVFFDLEVNGRKYLLVHAGINHFSRDKDLYEYDIDDFVWVRPDYEKAYYDDVIVISGHTPTQLIPGNPNPGYIYRKNNHIAMDCGAFSAEGRLAGVCLETGEEFYSR